MKKHKICVIGLGYIGLPTSALLANKGYEVYGVDVVQDTVDIINQGQIHIVEPELDIFVNAAVNSGKLRAGITPVSADIFIIAVPTPFQNDSAKNNPVPDISYVISAAESIAEYLLPGNIIILESTSPVGTTEKIRDILQIKGVDVSSLFIAHCPERVLPGQIMKELVENDRIIGGITSESTKEVSKFYKEFVNGKILETDARTAELCKLIENAYRDVNIAFANELSMISNDLNINPWELISLANHHPRVNILNPGPGVGGHCLAVDPWFIVDSSPDKSKLINTARKINDYKEIFVLDQIGNIAKEGTCKTIGCLGISFKPDVDDLRHSPAMNIVAKLAQSSKYNILIVEPNIRSLPDELTQYDNIELTTLNKVIKDADIIVILVGHAGFHKINKELLKDKEVLDTIGLLQ